MKRAILFVAVWILGCVIFDLLLNFQGPWLMLGGVITYWVALSIQTDAHKELRAAIAKATEHDA